MLRQVSRQMIKPSLGFRGLATGARTIVYRRPTVDDAEQMHKIVADGTLDTNSRYAYVMFADQFPNTCSVAVDGDKVLGFVMGHQPPQWQPTFFCWQVGVHPEAQGLGMASRLLLAAMRFQCQSDFHMQLDDRVELAATVTPNNAASRALFNGMGKKLNCPVEVVDGYYPAPLFREEGAQEAHEEEDLFKVGPFLWEDLESATEAAGLRVEAGEAGDVLVQDA